MVVAAAKGALSGPADKNCSVETGSVAVGVAALETEASKLCSRVTVAVCGFVSSAAVGGGNSAIAGPARVNCTMKIAAMDAERIFRDFLNTLLHEWLHHYDTRKLKLNSIHSKGFYLRLNDLQEKLKIKCACPATGGLGMVCSSAKKDVPIPNSREGRLFM